MANGNGKAGKKMPRIKYGPIRHEYITCEPRQSMTALAKKYGCGASTIRLKSMEEDWPRLRREAQAHGHYIAKQEVIKERAEEFVACDMKHLETAFKLQTKLLEFLDSWNGTIIPPHVLDMIANVALKILKLERAVHGRDAEKLEISGEINIVTQTEVDAIRERLFKKMGARNELGEA